MAGDNPRRGRDRVLESRHLVGLFLGVVLLCCVFFTLGYVMGRTQYTGSVHAAITPSKAPAPSPAASAAQQKPAATVATPAPSPGEWDFYPKKGAAASTPSAPVTAHPNQATAETKSPPVPPKAPARFRPPQIPHGATILQLAALTREGDAMALADALQQKKFPAFVMAPTADNLYRVQVGPYADAQSADLAKRSLEREGFKVIVKH
jgi:DedD protein